MDVRVYMETTLSVTVDAEIPDGIEDEEERRDAAISAAYDAAPGALCHQCASGRRNGRSWSRDVGDLELVEGDDAVQFHSG